MILVIGATSFIGVYTVDHLLSEGKKVVVTGRNNKLREYYESKGVEYINFDLANENDYSKLPKINVESIILLAGLLPANVNVDISKEDNAFEYIKINTLGTAYLLEHCRKHGISKIISTTSYADVLDSWDENKALTEEEPRNYRLEGDHTAYVISKNAATDLLLYYNKQHGMKNCIFRLPPVYGVGPHGSIYVDGKMKKSGIQIFIDKALEASDITIYGDGKLKRDVIYVKDVSRALLMATETSESQGLYNMTSGVQVTLAEQVEAIIEVFSCESSLEKSEILYDTSKTNTLPSYLFSMEKAKKDFGFVPEYKDFKKMMVDYKKELDNENYSKFFK